MGHNVMQKPDYLDELQELIAPSKVLWVPAHQNNYGYIQNGKPVINTPRAMCWHTPEETADSNEVTPVWFQNPDAQASTNFYVDNDGDLYHMVSLDQCAYGNGVTMKTRTWKGKRYAYAPWNSDHLNYNWITISVEVEGFGKSMDETLTRNQWLTCIQLGWWCSERFNIPKDRIHHFEHREVNIHKVDPGTFPTNLLVEEIAAYESTIEPAAVPASNTKHKYSAEMSQHIQEYHS